MDEDEEDEFYNNFAYIPPKKREKTSKPIQKEPEALLLQLYYDPEKSSGYGGIQKLYKATKQRIKSITLQDVRGWLRSQRTYTLHKPMRR